MNRTYGYARISRKTQDINRQIRNIKEQYPEAVIIQEAFTGTKTEGRNAFNKLIAKVSSGDTIVFDSVSRMSRNAEEGTALYFELVDRGVNLVFLKEHYVDSATYAESMGDRIQLTGGDEDEIFKGINNYFRKLAARQIRIAFNQAEKEVLDLRQRTKEGMETARINGKQIGQREGAKLNVKKKPLVMDIIRSQSKDFEGTNNDSVVMVLIDNALAKAKAEAKAKEGGRALKISRNTYYKYKAELKEGK